MFKTSKRFNYTIKNNTHIFTQETTIKISFLNITRTLLGKSINLCKWNIRKLERDNLLV